MKITAAFVLSLAGVAAGFSAEWSARSPHERQQVTVVLDAGQLSYRLDRLEGGKAIALLAASPLGLDTSSGRFGGELSPVEATTPERVRRDYKMTTGKQRRLRDEHTAWSVVVKDAAGAELAIDFRVYDDGLAFRYRIPRTATADKLTGERTGFRIASEGRAWIQPYQKIEPWAPAYEDYYTNGAPLGADAPGAEGWAFPALFETRGGWILLTEADADAGYFGAHLETKVTDRTYRIRPPLPDEAKGMGSTDAAVAGPWVGPWRVVVAGPTLAAIAESSLVHHVSRPPDARDWSWVKPGRATWSWWSEHTSPRDFKKITPFIDLAAEWGWEYSLVDANWNKMENGDIRELLAYAKKRNVGLLLWYNSGGKHNDITEEPRDRLVDRATRRAEFAKLQEWGVKGVKVDFFQSDKPWMLAHYLGILADAADFHLLVDFHGCTLPRGWQRTWPNLISMEAVRGAEVYSCCEEYGPMAVWHNAILPFTRNVVGSMDYTPVTFTNQKVPHQTTYAHELALSVVFESGVQHFADAVEGCRGLPDYAQRWLQEIPVVWDETRLVDGSPGELAVIARRRGDTWYLGGIDGARIPRTLLLKLPFLTSGNYTAEIITDGGDDHSFAHSQVALRGDEALKVETRPAGGFVAKIAHQ